MKKPSSLLKKKPGSALLLLCLPTIIAAPVVLILMNWAVPTRMQMDLIVDRAQFTVHAPETDSTLIFGAADYTFLSVQNFDRLSLRPDKLDVADMKKYNFKEDSFPESAWQNVVVPSKDIVIDPKNGSGEATATLESDPNESKKEAARRRVIPSKGALIALEVKGESGQSLTIRVTGRSPQALLSVEPMETAAKPLGTLDPIRAYDGAEVTLNDLSGRTSGITIELKNKERNNAFSVVSSVPDRKFRLITDNAFINVPLPGSNQGNVPQAYRVYLKSSSPFVKFSGNASMMLQIELASGENKHYLSKTGIPVSSISFVRQDENGNIMSTVMSAGEISYPAYPNIKAVSFSPGDFIEIDRIRKFNIKEISIDPQHQGLRFRLDGVTKHLVIRSGPFQKKAILTQLDVLLHNPGIIVFMTIVIWVFSTTVGGYKLYRGLRA